MDTYRVAFASCSYEDDEEPAGRIRSAREYAEQLARRADVFIIDKDTGLTRLEILSIAISLAVGSWLSVQDVARVVPDFISEYRERPIMVVDAIPVKLQAAEQLRRHVSPPKRKVLKPASNPGTGARSQGGGDRTARITRAGLLGIVSEQVTGHAIADAELFSKGGYNEGIDALLSGLGALKSGGSSGFGRKGETGIGFNVGYGPGVGDAGESIDGLLSGLLSSDATTALELKPRERIDMRTPAPIAHAGPAIGGRSKAGILRVVRQNLAALRYAYNRRLRQMPGLEGKITVRFAVDEFGKVLLCDVVESTMGDTAFDSLVLSHIRRWVFERIDKPGDVTEVIYPFVFSQ